MGRRLFEPGISVHAIQRGHNQCALFGDEYDYPWYLELLRHASDRYGLDVHTFTLMTNHVHLFVTPQRGRALPRTMKDVGHRYGKYFNKKYRRSGTLWNGRYRGKPVRDFTYALTCMRYIEQNPVRAGMAPAPGEYPWSSFRALALGGALDGLVPHPAYQMLGNTPEERRAAYRVLCAAAVSADEIVRLREP
jgi:putative transposase